MSISNWLTDDQLRDLLARYLSGAYHEDDWSVKLQILVQKTQIQVLNFEILDMLTDEVLVERILAIYRAIVRVPMYYKAITTRPKYVRAALHYLLESDDDIFTKVDVLMTSSGEHYIKGLGKSFWSVFLMALDPTQNPYWNNKTESALDMLGMKYWRSRDLPSEVYRQIFKAQHALSMLNPQINLYTLDHFMHYITVLEGADILAEWHNNSDEIDICLPITNTWSDRIAELQRMHLPPERIALRRESEAEARELLETNLGQLDVEMLRRFFKLVNVDFYGDKDHRDRFRPAFMGASAKHIFEQLDAFNDWSTRLWQVEDAELPVLLDTFWKLKPIAYAGTSLPTLLLYLRDPTRYYIWLKPMVQGLERITGTVIGNENGATYLRYIESINQVRMKYKLKPQEMDVILVLAGREPVTVVKESKVSYGKIFPGFDPDTFTFLSELQKHNTVEWLTENEIRYKKVLHEPLRALFEDVAPVIARIDPNLETGVKSGRVLARINKRWPDDVGPYYTYLWGAFYRAERSKQTDAQLYIIVYPDRLCVGIGVGKGAQEVLAIFQKNLHTYPELFYQLLSPMLKQGFVVTTQEDYGAETHQVKTVRGAADVVYLAELGFVNIERIYQRDDNQLYQSVFAIEVRELFEKLYPLYRFFISTDLTDLLEETLGDESKEVVISEENYSFEQLLVDTFLDPRLLEHMDILLRNKGQIVLYGPPGTGKTFVARRFAQYFVDQTGGEVQIVQFHPSYAYEEFVEGIKPRSENGQLTYPVEAGIFRSLCDYARHRPTQRYVLIVDEINRGSLPRIFGELLYLLEYRDETNPVILPYSHQRFTIPSNVYIIGTMNTADRSIALVDHALRRRFYFIPMKPDPEILRSWLETRNNEIFTWVADLLEEVNQRLTQDHIDWHLHIGHSYWMIRDGRLDAERSALIWAYAVKPTLEEYFYNRTERLKRYDYETLQALVTKME